MLHLKDASKLGKFKFNNLFRNYLYLRHQLTTLIWECTLVCNFSCKHCGSDAKKSKKDELKTPEIIKAIQQISQDFITKNIMIEVTGGEPLLRKDLFKVMKYASKLGFSWGMVTNGYLLDENVIKKMKRSGLKTISVSIDGTEKTHEQLRMVKGSYDRAIGAIKLLVKANFLDCVQITTCVYPANLGELDRLYQTFSDLKVDSWRLINIDPIGRALNNKRLFLGQSQFNKLLSFIIDKRGIRPDMEVTYGCTGFLGLDYENEVRNHFFYCQAGINIGSILSNGDIFVCPNVDRRQELIQGNVRNDKFSEIWNNRFIFFRNKYRTSCQKCLSCLFWNECLGNSLHLWNFEDNIPKVCQLDLLKQ